MAAGIIDENASSRRCTEINVYRWQVKDWLLRACKVGSPRVQRNCVGKVLGEKAFSGTGDQNEREVGIILGYMRKLGDKMLANAPSA